MFDTNRHHTTSPNARERLARLARQAGDRADPDDDSQEWIDVTDRSEQPPSEAAPRAPAWLTARAGRLVERWVPGAGGGRHRKRRFRIFASVALLLGVVTGAVAIAGQSSTPARAGAVTGLPVAMPAAQSARPAPGPTIVISVVGRVVTPGVITVADGSRVADAVRAAGGALPGTNLVGLNLARRLVDGEQIYVGITPPPEAAGPGPGPSGRTQPSRTLALNTSTVPLPHELPGVGQVIAQRIADWRTKHGRFTSVDQLRQVDGLTGTRLVKLRDRVTVR